MTPTFTESLSWLTEFMAEKHPELPTYYPAAFTMHVQAWGNDFIEYYLHNDEMTGPWIECENVEIKQIPIFRFIIPSTKEDLFTVLNILDKP